MDVKGKVVLITGASAGIGKVTAELFNREGARVALSARSADKLREMSAAMTDSLVVPADMSKPDEVRRMVQATYDHYGRLDVLINNAGQGMYQPVEFINVDDMAQLMWLNVYGPIIAMQAAIPLMRKQGGGAIVNISSQTSRNTFPSISPYAATKSALNMITLTARKELAGDGIVVSLVYPRLTTTDFRKNAVKNRIEFRSPQRQPQRQMPDADPPEKVADVILAIVKSGEAEALL